MALQIIRANKRILLHSNLLWQTFHRSWRLMVLCLKFLPDITSGNCLMGSNTVTKMVLLTEILNHVIFCLIKISDLKLLILALLTTLKSFVSSTWGLRGSWHQRSWQGKLTRQWMLIFLLPQFVFLRGLLIICRLRQQTSLTNIIKWSKMKI